MKINNLGFLFLFISCFFGITTYAYNPYGISDGLYMKLQEEKSDLEYRINQLETNSYNSPGLSSMNIQSRINDLIRERDSKKNYARGTYASYGATEMLQVALDKIDDEYNQKIQSLEDQKDYYDQESSYEEQARENKEEAQKLKKKLLEIEAELISQKRIEVEKQIEVLKNTPKVEFNLINELTNNSQKSPPPAIDVFNALDSMPDTLESAQLYSAIKEKDFSMYTKIQALASVKYFNNKTTPLDLFNYMDSLSEENVHIVNDKLGIFNPTLQDEVYKLARAKYPNGKEYGVYIPVNTTNTVKNPLPPKENSKPVISRTALEDIPKEKTEVLNREQALVYYNEIKKLKSEGKIDEAQSIIDEMSEGDYKVFESLANELKATTSPKLDLEKEEVKAKSISQKFFGFFKKLAFWR